MTLVFNASPLIVLAKANLLERIIDLPDRVFIPLEVAEEVKNCDDPNDPACRWLKRPETAVYLQEAPHLSDFVAAWGLGAGESSVLSLAGSLSDATAVLDDLALQEGAR